MLELAKHNAKELDALRRRLALAGFYDDLPLDLRPMPPDLLSVAGRRLVAETCQGLAQFEGIYREGFPHQTVEVSEERIIDWIRQFDDDFTADALVVAHNLRMLSRSDCVNALIEFLEKHPDYDGASWTKATA